MHGGCASLLRLPLLCALAGLCLVSGIASAQVAPIGEKQMGPISTTQPADLKKISVTQKLNTLIPLDGVFRDENGKTVHLGDYFGHRPVILSLVYYQCKILCPEEINGLVGALEMVKFNPGKDFNVVFVSIDPTETPQIASREKAVYMQRYGRPGTENGWHFLTGNAASIRPLANAVGFGYTPMEGPDGKMTQFAHASSVELLTPEGRLSQYYLGVEFSPKDLQLGLVESSHDRIGSPVDNILTYCYRYDPQLNRHSLIIAHIVQLGCLLTVLLLGSYMVVMFRRDLKQSRTITGKLANG
ncbi:SCO family protein [Paracidobacterium acidisoli]|uniref:SCO family protein n=1 Tax=Paracidobacterium acidisoli TaxID=2303751 RepID=A0A372ING8_9BACT|nr:SCO family protein [Paracidobacterium acidisoli]MBT9332175.1 SCO family protein [Paracidobacterium acidisoli]